MLSFDYHNPTRVVFGKGRVAALDQLVAPDAKVLILTGGSSAERNGTLAEVRAALGSRVHETFVGIEANPDFSTCLRAVARAREGSFDLLLAVGGGSVIDAAKFIAAAVPFEGDPWEILLKGGRGVHAAMPFGAVLTLPATGSEMNNGSVITRRELDAKLAFRSPHVFPVFSVLDPTKTYTLPPRQLANGVVDAFVHTVEQYLTYPVGGVIQDRFAEGILHTLIEVGPRILAASEPDYDDRATFMWTATLALNGLIGAGVPQDWATHMIGHELTALHDIDHARTLALVLPSLLDDQRDTKRVKLLQYADRVWGLKSGTDDERITGAIEATRAFFESLGVPTRLRAYDIQADAIDALVASLESHGMGRLGERGDVTLPVSRRILERAL